MGKVTVTVLDATGSKEQKASLPDDAPVRRILAKLIEMMKMPSTGPDGQPMSYKFHHKASGKQLLDSHSLFDAGVQDGDILRVQPEITAG